MDTTSHDFTWEIDTLGNLMGFGMMDVAIINDTCVWIAGEINVMDSLGNWKDFSYNVARWNGASWSLMTSMDSAYGYYQNYSIFAFNDSDLWVGGKMPQHWDGREWTTPGSWRWGGLRIMTIWGTSSINMYAGSDYGNIFHFDGMNWNKIEIGTSFNVMDFWGSTNRNTGEMEILAVASNVVYPFEHCILQISGSTVSTLNDSGIISPIWGVWFEAGREYYVAGLRIYRNHDPYKNKLWLPDSEMSSFSYMYMNSIRANGINDVIVANDFGDIFHFNGFTSRNYKQQIGLEDVMYHSVAIRGDLAIAVGKNKFRIAIVAIGRR